MDGISRITGLTESDLSDITFWLILTIAFGVGLGNFLFGVSEDITNDLAKIKKKCFSFLRSYFSKRPEKISGKDDKEDKEASSKSLEK